ASVAPVRLERRVTLDVEIEAITGGRGGVLGEVLHRGPRLELGVARLPEIHGARRRVGGLIFCPAVTASDEEEGEGEGRERARGARRHRAMLCERRPASQSVTDRPPIGDFRRAHVPPACSPGVKRWRSTSNRGFAGWRTGSHSY